MSKRETQRKVEARRKVFKRLNKTMSMRAIGRQFGISGERVRQIISGAEQPNIEDVVTREYINKLDKILKTNLWEEIERLSGQDRRKSIVLQRQALIRKLRDDPEYNLSFKQIGFLLKRGHPAIINLYYGRKPRKKGTRTSSKNR